MTEYTSHYDTSTYKPVAQLDESTQDYVDCEPFVRFCDDGKQEPELRRANESIPEGSGFASPIYYLTLPEKEEQSNLDNPYAISEGNMANHLQNRVEAERREYYPIYVESDAEVPLDKQARWIRKFAREELEVNPDEGSWYYSGGGSIHLHLPKLVRQSDLEVLRGLTKEFEHDLDPQIYTRKRQFRLPGAKHDTTGLPKVAINPEWSHERIVREAATSDVSTPDTYEEVLTQTFGKDVMRSPESYLWRTDDPTESGRHDWETHTPNMGYGTLQKWKAHYSSPVSPYAKAGNGQRSLLVAKVHDGVYAEKRETHYHEGGGKRPQIFVPCEVFAFWGCDREYTVSHEYRPVRLSKGDYAKFEESKIGEGDFFVLIGGQSRKSILHTPGTFEAKTIAGSTSFSGGIETLEWLEYDTGESNSIDSQYNTNTDRQNDETRASRLQKRAENEGIESLSHGERLLIALRLLSTRGIDGTREWFKAQYGDEYDPEVTNTHLKSACKKYDDTPKWVSHNVTKTSI